MLKLRLPVVSALQAPLPGAPSLENQPVSVNWQWEGAAREVLGLLTQLKQQHTGSYMTVMNNVQLGQCATSSPA